MVSVITRGDAGVCGKALINLGYPKNLAEKTLDAARALGAGSLEGLLRQSLKSLAK